MSVHISVTASCTIGTTISRITIGSDSHPIVQQSAEVIVR